MMELLSIDAGSLVNPSEGGDIERSRSESWKLDATIASSMFQQLLPAQR